MAENTTDDDAFINAYLRKQEEFGTEQIRKRLELEVRMSFLEQAYKEKLKECAEAQNALSQAVVGLQAATIERDKAKDELDRALASLSDSAGKVNESVYEINALKDKLKAAEALRVDLDVVRNNYSIVLKQLEEAQQEVQSLRSAQQIKAVPSKKKKESEWVDGNEA